MALGRGEFVQRLACVLLKVQPLDADGDALGRRHVDNDLALADDRILELRDLIALRQIGIKIVFAVEHRAMIDLRLEAKPGADRLGDAFLVDDRQHAGHGRVDQRDMIVRLAAIFGAGAGKQLGAAGHLGMDFHADDDFPIARRAVDEFGGDGGCYVHGGPRRLVCECSAHI